MSDRSVYGVSPLRAAYESFWMYEWLARYRAGLMALYGLPQELCGEPAADSPLVVTSPCPAATATPPTPG